MVQRKKGRTIDSTFNSPLVSLSSKLFYCDTGARTRNIYIFSSLAVTIPLKHDEEIAGRGSGSPV